MTRIITILFLLFSFFQCTEKAKEKKEFIEVKDALGRPLKINAHPKKVLALTSSITEILHMICPDSQIVGRTQNCNYPASIVSKPIVNNYPIDYEKLLQLKPDLVFAKDGVVSLEEASKIQSMGIPVYFQHYDNLEDVFTGIEVIGKLLSKEDRGKFVADSLRNEILKFKSDDTLEYAPKVLLVISIDKIYVFGKDSYVSDMIDAAGGVNAMGEILNNPFPQISSEYVIQINPDIIIVCEGDYSSVKEKYPEWENVKAVKNGRIYSIHSDLISRPGPRAVKGVEFIHRIIHEKYEE